MSQCYKLKNKETKFVGLTNIRVPKINCSKPVDHDSKEIINNDSHLNKFEGFLSKGNISPISDVNDKKSIVILRDSACAQSMLLKDVIPFEPINEGKSVIIEGINTSKLTPLQKVNLESDVKIGPVEVAIVDNIPVKGVQFLLGNDIAGNVINNLPIVMNKPKLIDDSDRFKDEIPNVFPACVATRAMAKYP